MAPAALSFCCLRALAVYEQLQSLVANCQARIPVDVERAAVELPVAVGMEQSEIIERVGAALVRHTT